MSIVRFAYSGMGFRGTHGAEQGAGALRSDPRGDFDFHVETVWSPPIDWLETPHLDPVPESGLNAMAPTGVSIHAVRVPLGMVGPDGDIIPQIGPDVARAFSEPPEVDHAVKSLCPLKPHAIIYAFTSSSYIMGSRDDARLKARLEEASAGIPMVTQTPALVAAFGRIKE